MKRELEEPANAPTRHCTPNLLPTIWNWLLVFEQVASFQSIRAAAEVLRRSPSAVTRTIGQLEERLGLQLFVREGRRMWLTSAGARLFGAVESCSLGLDFVLNEISAPDFDEPAD